MIKENELIQEYGDNNQVIKIKLNKHIVEKYQPQDFTENIDIVILLSKK